MIKLSPLAIKSLSGIAISVLLSVLPSTTMGWTLVKEEQLTRHQAKVERLIHEQKASEEAERCTDVGSTEEKGISEAYEERISEKAVTKAIQAEVEVLVEEGSGYSVSNNMESAPIYAVDGDTLDPEIAAYLYERLEEQGIPQFMDYAVLIAYQESGFNALAENKNGRDKGFYQYRIEYFPDLDWTSPYAEIDLFAVQMGNRARAGKTVAEMISAHMMSDYGEYCQEYVDAVLGHSLERK